MQPDVLRRLETLRGEFAEVTGSPFNHFFCPILFVDEAVELCQAHIVNKASALSSRRWTLQRKDVDNFYGSAFEAEFLDLQLDQPGLALKALVDPSLHRRLRPKVLLDGTAVEHFVARGRVPARFPVLHIQQEETEVTLALKMTPEEIDSVRQESNWQFEVSRDLRVQAVVSVLKAAHLSMFELFGYGYALAPNGVWIGQLLGSFFMGNRSKPKPDILVAASAHFEPFAGMVRPVESMPPAITGSVDDRWFHLCLGETDTQSPWGIITYVRTGKSLHAVLLPTLADQAACDRFEKLLNRAGDSFEVSIMRFETSHWTRAKERQLVNWPAANWCK